MRDGVEEAVLLLISPDFADEKDRVDDEPGNEHTEEDDAEDERNDLPPVKDDPADVEDDRQGNEQAPSVMKNAMSLVRLVIRMMS